MKRLAALLLVFATAASAEENVPPYWAAIRSGEAMMRTGPARSYPGVWLYKRRNLPVQVLKRYESWRLIKDPDGQQGWMLGTMLTTDYRTALVQGSEPRPIYAQPNAGSKVRYRAEPGVVGRISQCGSGWCHIEVGQREGFIEVASLWGLEPNESID